MHCGDKPIGRYSQGILPRRKRRPATQQLLSVYARTGVPIPSQFPLSPKGVQRAEGRAAPKEEPAPGNRSETRLGGIFPQIQVRLPTGVALPTLALHRMHDDSFPYLPLQSHIEINLTGRQIHAFWMAVCRPEAKQELSSPCRSKEKVHLPDRGNLNSSFVILPLTPDVTIPRRHLD